MSEHATLRRLADGTPAPVSCWKSTASAVLGDDLPWDPHDEAGCIELARKLNVAPDRVCIQNRALNTGSIYPYYYEVCLDSSDEPATHGSSLVRLAVTPDMQNAYFIFLSHDLQQVEDVVDLLRIHRVETQDTTSIQRALDRAETTNGTVPWILTELSPAS